MIGALGAVFLRNYAPAVPYTVGLLIVGIALGITAHIMSSGDSCPTHALDAVFDADHSGSITRTEWDYFTCADCEGASVCASPDYHRACLASEGCASFDELDMPFHYTAMDPASAMFAVRNYTAAFLAPPDGVLYPEELWYAPPQASAISRMQRLYT